MSLPEPNNAAYPTPIEVRSQLLSDLRYAYSRIGIDLNVAEGTEPWIRMDAIANRISIALGNNQIAAKNFSPLTATGDDLEELAGIYGISKRPAAAAAGNVTITTTAATITIPSDFICTAPNGQQYATLSALTVADQATVPVQAIEAGSDTDQAAATVMTWDSAAIGQLGQNCVVTSGTIDGGQDKDGDEELRGRLLRRLGFPEAGGNWAQIASWAEDATASIQAAFVYPAARGPSSYDVAVTGATGDRQLSANIVTQAAANILANMPGSEDLNATPCNPVYVDVIINMTLPLPINAGGVGGGFRDGIPWPSTSQTGTNVYAEVVSSWPSLNKLRVNSTSVDIPRQGGRFGIWNPAGGDDGYGKMAEFTILAVTGSSGAYDIEIDGTDSDSLSFVTAGMYCSVGAENLVQYAEAFRAAMMLLGPGEKSDNPDIIPRALRKPTSGYDWPTDVTYITLASVFTGREEVLNMNYELRAATGTYTAMTSPAVPATPANQPNILVLNNLSFRAQL